MYYAALEATEIFSDPKAVYKVAGLYMRFSCPPTILRRGTPDSMGRVFRPPALHSSLLSRYCKRAQLCQRSPVHSAS